MEWVEVEKPVIEKPKNELACSCVRWVNHLNPKAPLVDARFYASFKLSPTPTLGSIVVFKYPNNYHIAKVIKLKENTFIVSESNFKECEIEDREVPYDSDRILGYFTP